MRRATSAILRGGAVAVVVLAGAACQASDDDATPIEEPTTVTGPTSDDENTGDATPPDSTPATDPATSDPATSTTTPDETTGDDQPPDESAPATRPTLPSDVFATTPTTQPRGPAAPPATETVYDVGMIDPGLAPFVSMATADLADRLGVDGSAVEVLTAVVVTWPDGSLGCPEPDMAYAQVTSDGAVIELGVDGTVYRYHSGGSRTPFPCERPLDPAPRPQTTG